MERSRCLYALTLAGLLWSHAIACAQIDLTPIALTGQNAPGVPGAFQGVAPPTINAAGEVAFIAFTGSSSAWLSSASGLQLLAASPDAIPGTTSTLSSIFSPLFLDDAGGIVFLARQFGAGVTSSTEEVILRVAGSGLEAVAIPEGPSPIAGATWTFGDDFTVSTQGVIALVAELDGPGFDPFNNGAIFRGGPGSWERLLIDALPSPFPGFGYVSVEAAPPINASGAMACPVRVGEFTGNGIQNAKRSFLIVEDDASVSPLALSGEPSPEPGLEYIAFGGQENVAFNDAGQGLVAGRIGQENTPNDLQSLLSFDSHGVAVVAIEGQRAPGTSGSYTTFQSAIRGVMVNASGVGAFIARFDNGLGAINTGLGLYRVENGAVEPLAVGGQAAPQFGAGVRIAAPLAPSINAGGRIVAQVTLNGAVTADNNSALVATDNNGILVPVLRTGDTVDIDPGPSADLRTIDRIDIIEGSGGQDGRPRSLNDQDELALFLRFTDNSEGVFVLSLANLEDAVVCEADIDGDGDVDLGDFGLFGIAFGSQWNVGIDYDPRADYDADGDVDLGDFGVFGTQFGRSGCPGS